MQTVYFVNAFTLQTPHSGNPAAVCILDEWLAESTMQAMAAQHNLAETAFVVETGSGQFTIRWFTPTMEIDLCGHATLAAAHVLITRFGVPHDILAFESASGTLFVRREPQLTLDFPIRKLAETEQAFLYQQAFNLPGAPVFYNELASLIECESEETVRNFQPNIAAIESLPARIHYLTAVGKSCDFVCRVFAPKLGIPEDSVTGSAYTSLMPYWSEKLQCTSLKAKQFSPRGGDISLGLSNDRVLIGGQAQTVIVGEWAIEVDHGY